MLFSLFPLVFAHFLCLLCPALGQGTGEKSLAETLYDLGDPLFSPIKEGETANLLARWIPFNDIKEPISLVWDYGDPLVFLGVVVTDKGAWVFKIEASYQKKIFPQSLHRQASFIYEDDDFFNMIAYPLFGHVDPRRAPPEPPVGVPSRSPYALSELSLDKKDYRKAFIISAKGLRNAGPANEPFITALAWAITHNTGLQVQLAGQEYKHKKPPMPIVLHRKPLSGTPGSQDLEIFESGSSLLKATVTSSKLDITHYDGFKQDSFPEMKDEKPDRTTQLERLWNRYPDLTEEFGYEQHKPKAALRMWNLDLEVPMKIFRHLNDSEQKIKIIILVVTTQGFWSLALSHDYLKTSGMRSVLLRGAEIFRSQDPFLKLKSDVLEGFHPDSWQHASKTFGCLGASLIDIVVLETIQDASQNQDFWLPAIKDILKEMMKVSSSEANLPDEALSDEHVLLHGLEKRQIPYFQFATRTGISKGARNHRLLMRHYTSPDVADAQGKEYGVGEWFEFYYGEKAIIKGATGPKPKDIEENYVIRWSDQPSKHISLSQKP